MQETFTKVSNKFLAKANNLERFNLNMLANANIRHRLRRGALAAPPAPPRAFHLSQTAEIFVALTTMYCKKNCTTRNVTFIIRFFRIFSAKRFFG